MNNLALHLGGGILLLKEVYFGDDLAHRYD